MNYLVSKGTNGKSSTPGLRNNLCACKRKEETGKRFGKGL